jgi:hypothetical protein
MRIIRWANRRSGGALANYASPHGSSGEAREALDSCRPIETEAFFYSFSSYFIFPLDELNNGFSEYSRYPRQLPVDVKHFGCSLYKADLFLILKHTDME